MFFVQFKYWLNENWGKAPPNSICMLRMRKFKQNRRHKVLLRPEIMVAVAALHLRAVGIHTRQQMHRRMSSAHVPLGHVSPRCFPTRDCFLVKTTLHGILVHGQTLSLCSDVQRRKLTNCTMFRLKYWLQKQGYLQTVFAFFRKLIGFLVNVY